MPSLHAENANKGRVCILIARRACCSFMLLGQKVMSSMSTSGSSPLATIKKHWFIVGVILVISCARLAPWVGAKQG